MDERIHDFERHRKMLEGVAYRMLGSLADAHDVVQDTYLKWRRATDDDIRDPRAWLITVCSRLSINALKSARKRREVYVGAWLPEPLVSGSVADPSVESEIDQSVSIALLVALERLSPAERAAYVLFEVFDYSFDELAAILGKSAAACRQLASRARFRLRHGQARYAATPDEHRRLLAEFLTAARHGDVGSLEILLSQSAELHADGGGKVPAAMNVVKGAEEVAHFIVDVWRNYTRAGISVDGADCWINGAPGAVLRENGVIATALSAEVDYGKIRRVYAVRNPDKLSRISNFDLVFIAA